MPTVSKPKFDSMIDEALHRIWVQFWVMTVVVVVTCGAISFVAYMSHHVWWKALLNFVLLVLFVMTLRVLSYFQSVRQIHYLDYKVRKTERITDECVTTSRELREQIDAGVNVWSSNGPPQA